MKRGKTRNGRTSSKRRDRSEVLTALTLISLLAGGGYWLIESQTLRVTNAQLSSTQDKPIDVLGEYQCRPSCHAALRRCQVSTGGFIYLQSRCQETLKQCLIGCESKGGAILQP